MNVRHTSARVRILSPPNRNLLLLLGYLLFGAVLVGSVGATVAGKRLSGWSWAVPLILIAVLCLILPVNKRLLKRMWPLWGYVAYSLAGLAFRFNDVVARTEALQILTWVGAFYIGWHLARVHPLFLPRLQSPAAFSLGLVACVRVFGALAEFPVLTSRPSLMAVVMRFILSTQAGSRRRMLLLWAVALIAVLAAGGRMATLALAFVLVLHPLLRLKWNHRLLVAAVVALIGLMSLHTSAVQARTFFGDMSEATTSDLVAALPQNLNTMGRAELWPAIASACTRSQPFGRYVGYSRELTSSLTGGNNTHPHNEYLRTYCDIGLANAALMWLFVVGFVVRWWRDSRPLQTSTGGVAHTSGLVALCILLFGVTDNILVYVPQYMGIGMLVLGFAWEQRTEQRERIPRSAQDRGVNPVV